MYLLALPLGALMGLGVWLLLVPPSVPKAAPGPLPIFAPVTRLLDEAGFGHLSAGAVLAVGALTATAIGSLVTLIVPIAILGPLSAGAMGMLAYGFILRQRSSRHHRLRVSWPGVIDHIRAGIRSGSDVVRSVSALPSTLPPDIRVPIEEFRVDIARGMSVDSALGELGRRLADPVGDRIIEVLRMAHEVGGTDLPDVLNALQRSVRHDIAVREDATAKQSWIRSAAVMAVAAPWVVLVVIGSRAETVIAYQSLEGTALLLVGALVSVVAYRIMHSIGSLPAQRRWVG